ncbi:MAG TPA: dihydroorotase [Deltaproteobacteria bacterium]|nr:MAG: dihydroorotase [Deltaproteobacteria bacterium GWA2_55_82]OGQ63246.1 MAG: dihydroorotase [Deltaproteobacteria bacterium RIFCSPLOWO2_02_FULL_55_12]OIJ73081.1 MAG: dihydroorotase [Deltaproteobacteria bacterium GWC2_55_46]HBG47843.1 dihydroorotase [Deltaproteobacteria bacterium]HCY11894.1 dihydroorotase [Deltaproteobacteria bacterium]
MTRLVIRGGRLVDPAQNIDGFYNIYIMGGRVASVKKAEADTSEVGPGVEAIDATGKVVMPGFIDAHAHLREPGYEYKEDIRTGSLAASAGGFTAVMCMANTKPVNDNESVTRYILRRAEEAGCRVYPIGALSVGQKGERLTEMAELKAAGCVAVSDDGVPVVDSAFMRRALEYSLIVNIPVISHAEEPSLVGGGVMNEGEVATRLGLRGIPNAAEDAMVARDITLSELTGGRLHVAHVSTKGAVELIRRAKERGVKVTAEVTPHHLALTDKAVSGYDTNAKMSPPLRSVEDVEALRIGVKDGTIDCIATDHAPHSIIEKDVEFDKASNGIIGLETAFSVVYGLVEAGILTLSQVVKAMSTNPAKVFKLEGGRLSVGSQADITIVDLGQRWKVEPRELKSKSKNTPWAGLELKAVVLKTIVAGNVKFSRP